MFGKYLTNSPSALPVFQNLLTLSTLSISVCKFPSSLIAGTPVSSSNGLRFCPNSILFVIGFAPC